MGVGGFFLTDSLTPLLAIEAAEVIPHAQDELIKQAVEILAYAKENASWQDRTGDARAGLDIDVDQEGTEIILSLFHTVDYGLYLETIQSGRFAIIMPTLEHFSKQVLDSVGAVETGGLE